MIKIEFDIEGFKKKINHLMDKNIDLLDAIITIADRENIELETLILVLKKDQELKGKLEKIGNNLRMLKNPEKNK
jgi:hypothetical protein